MAKGFISLMVLGVIIYFAFWSVDRLSKGATNISFVEKQVDSADHRVEYEGYMQAEGTRSEETLVFGFLTLTEFFLLFVAFAGTLLIMAMVGDKNSGRIVKRR